MATYRLFPTAQWTVKPGILGRLIPGWCLVSGHHGRRVVRRLLVVGLRHGSVSGRAEIRAVGCLCRRDRDCIPAATVTSAALTAGQWNYIPLASPLLLSIGACYNACTGFTGSFPGYE